MTGNFSDNPTIRQGSRRAPAPPPTTIAAAVPHLDIIEAIGQGGMGVVYKARQRELDRVVALKVLLPEPDRDPAFAERFAREARALARLHHPNIVAVYDSGRAGDLYYFVMEYVDGVTLRQVMADGGAAPEHALSYVSQICGALQYAHDEGVMHRDIKPENILIDRRGRVRIADFGLAKLLAHRETDYTLTAPQQAMGTVHYMAPEQIENASAVDQRADIYALGVLFYEMLTGELPIGRFPLPSERSLDRRLDTIVLRALEKEPSRRYQRVSELQTDIDTLAGHPTHAPQAAAAPVDQRPVHPSHAPGSHASPAGGPPGAVYAAVGDGMTAIIPIEQRSTGTAYLLWLLGFVGLCGIHRFYAGKWVTGILWVLTGGLLFIGQLVDLILIPGMIRMSNLQGALLAQASIDGSFVPPPPPASR